MRRLPLPLVLLTVAFGGAMVWLLVTALVPRRVPTFEPRSTPPHDTAGTDTVTLDTRDPDRWQFFAFGRGTLVPPDTAGWDLAARRYHVITARGVARLDTISFNALVHAPAAGFVATSYQRDTVNGALARWYRYSMFSHLLHPRREVYVVRTHAGGQAKLEFLGYYCPGPEPGCLTFRYGRIGE